MLCRWPVNTVTGAVYTALVLLLVLVLLLQVQSLLTGISVPGYWPLASVRIPIENMSHMQLTKYSDARDVAPSTVEHLHTAATKHARLATAGTHHSTTDVQQVFLPQQPIVKRNRLASNSSSAKPAS
jgi:hypothetical protein